MVGKLAVAASVVLLAISASIAHGRGDPTYSLDQVRSAFATQDYSLVAPTVGKFAERSEGTVLFPPPVREPPFYLFVARNDLMAGQFYAPLAKFGQGGDSLDILRGNVVVVADGPVGRADRRRIEAAMQALDDSLRRRRRVIRR
jgi:hypothetical protein